MFEDIEKLIIDEKYEEAKQVIDRERSQISTELNKISQERFLELKKIELRLMELGVKLYKVVANKDLAKHNKLFRREMGDSKYINYVISLIKTGQFNKDYIQSLNPDLDLDKYLLASKSNKSDWLRKSQLLKLHAKTENPKYVKELQNIAKVIDDPKLSILILGEPGVGKSYMAEKIHEVSNRKGGFAKLSCGAFSSEERWNQNLWGYEEGSHSTAKKKYLGLIEKVKHGTLFLDEIDRLPKESRDAILTFIDDKHFQRLGSDEITIADVRFIFGTNKNPDELQFEEKIETDFFDRINQATLTIPPLRERKEDFWIIYQSIVQEINKELGIDIFPSQNVVDSLSNLQWPDNVRGLVKFLRIKMNECKAEGFVFLSDSFSKEELPHQEPTFTNKDFDALQKMLHKFILEFYRTDKTFIDKIEDRNFLDAFIKPILAKIYIEDMGEFPSKKGRVKGKAEKEPERNDYIDQC